MSNPELDAVLHELARHGVASTVAHGGKHLRVYFQGRHGRAFVLVGCTSGDGNAYKHSVARVRRLLGVTGGRHKSTRPGRRRPRVVAPPQMPREVTPGGPGLSGLERHKLMPTVLKMRADDAWRGLWRDICQGLFGAGSIAETVR